MQFFLILLPKESMYNAKIIDPITEPCGTVRLTFFCVKKTPHLHAQIGVHQMDLIKTSVTAVQVLQYHQCVLVSLLKCYDQCFKCCTEV